MTVTTDGGIATMGSLLTGRTVILMVSQHQESESRTVAEIAWVIERLDHELALIVVWPPGIQPHTQPSPARTETQTVIDLTGDVGRMLAPGGHGRAWLVDEHRATITILTADSSIFSPGRGNRPGSQQPDDHVIDLGDVYR